MKAFLIGGVAALALGAVAPALAQAPAAPMAPHAPMAMKAHTRAEVQAKVAEHFARLDTNRDGYLVKAEADAGRDAMRGQMRERFAKRLAERGPKPGAPGAGAPHQRRDPGAMFDRLDANKDGMISRQEFDAGHQGRDHRMAMRGHGKDGMKRMHHRRGGMGTALHGRMFEVADANKDGRVTLAEATAVALQHFDTADLNRDGQLTPQERMQGRERMRQQRRPS